jgi:uncharacterized protein
MRSYTFVATVIGVATLRWIWNDDKNRGNKCKHGLSFEAAQYVFADPLALTRQDSSAGEIRYQTVGLIGGQIVFVVHTLPALVQEIDEETGRIISARKATAYERRAYEEGTF